MHPYIRELGLSLGGKDDVTKKYIKYLALLATSLLLLVAVFPTFAQEEDPVIFVVGEGSTSPHGSGWYAGYVIVGRSGTYILNISATGSPSQYPITDVKLIVLASDEAAGGGLKSISVEGVSIVGFQPGKPPYYTANGGPFQEPDYYGYNDTYVIPGGLTYDEAHHPDHARQITVTVEFQSTATKDSKIAFLCHGIEAKDMPAETPFSGQTMFTISELAGTILGLAAMGGAYGVYKVRKRREI